MTKNYYYTLISTYFNKGHERSIKAKKNILATILVRIFSILISFILVPLTINYVESDSYGIWLTLSSIVGWASFFNLGINNGLRNKLTESLAVGNMELSQKYVSTTYAILILIFIPLFFIFTIIAYYLDWSSVLNSHQSMAKELYIVSIIVFGYFCIRFILSTINIILFSYQMPAGESIRGLIEQIFSLLIIFILTKTTTGSLLNLSIGLCIAPLVILLYFNFALFHHKFKAIRPQINKIDFSVSKDLLGIGFRFFVIQIASIVQFQTANFIIINSFTPNDVTVYNVAFKYFSTITMVMGIFMTPLWSAVTDAYAKKDIKWIINSVKKYQLLSFILVVFGLFMLIVSDNIYTIWLGKGKIVIPFSVSFWLFIFSAISVIGGLFCGILNGISALKIQFYASLFSPFIFVSLTLLFINIFHFGVESLIIASIIANFNAIILAPLQYYKIFIQNSKNQIWSS